MRDRAWLSDELNWLDEAHRVREATLPLCRALIQLSARCIRASHRREFSAAQELLEQAKAVKLQLDVRELEHSSMANAGPLHDARKEYVEAAVVFAVIKGDPAPLSAQIGVPVPAYLNGLAEAASECRRYVLDELRNDRLEDAGRVLDWMDGVYGEILIFDHPDAVTGGLRRTTDALRGVLERTRSDFILALTQQRTQRAIASFTESNVGVETEFR